MSVASPCHPHPRALHRSYHPCDFIRTLCSHLSAPQSKNNTHQKQQNHRLQCDSGHHGWSECLRADDQLKTWQTSRVVRVFPTISKNRFCFDAPAPKRCVCPLALRVPGYCIFDVVRQSGAHAFKEEKERRSQPSDHFCPVSELHLLGGSVGRGLLPQVQSAVLGVSTAPFSSLSVWLGQTHASP